MVTVLRHPRYGDAVKWRVSVRDRMGRLLYQDDNVLKPEKAVTKLCEMYSVSKVVGHDETMKMAQEYGDNMLKWSSGMWRDGTPCK